MKSVSSFAVVFSLFMMTGCVSKPTATVEFTYTSQPKAPLVEEYMKIAVYEAETKGSGEYDQEKWKGMAADLIRHHLQNAGDELNMPIEIVDREHMGIASAESDMAAAGITEGGDKESAFADATAIITTKLNVKIDKQKGKGTSMDAAALVGTVWGGGGGVSTREVDEEARTITVQCQFQMKANDGSNQIIHNYSGDWEMHSEQLESGFFFGSAQTEQDMTPRDKVIGGIVKKQLQKFTAKFLPSTTKAEVQVESSNDENCIAGVEALVVSDWQTALTNFKKALAVDRQDDLALFGAGVACEKLGQFSEALKYYKQARSYEDGEPKYAAAIARVSDRA